MSITFKDCVEKAKELDIEITGDIKYRGNCNKEDSDLASFFAWVRFNYPEYAFLIFHPESEFNPVGGSSYAYHAKSKAKGRVDGLADIICLPISKIAPAFTCELKRVNLAKSLTTLKRKEHFFKQLMILGSQKEAGNVAIVALGFEAIKKAFIEHVEMYGDKK